MTTVAFEKEVFCLPETIVRQYYSFKLEKKHLISINGKKKFIRILSCLFGGRRKDQVKKSAFEDFMLVFFTAESLYCSETTE